MRSDGAGSTDPQNCSSALAIAAGAEIFPIRRKERDVLSRDV